MDKDLQHGGTNRDGTHNPDYCSFCYANGMFRSPQFTAKQMQAFCLEKLREKGTPKPLAWLLTRNIPKLQRWRPAQPER